MLNIIHGADFHLDSPFSGLSPERAAQRRGVQRDLLTRLAQLAREKQADLVLLSGDLMDGETVYRETAQALSQALGGIPCPVFLAPGNHDCYSPSSAYATLDWPDNVHIFTSPAVEGVDLPQLNCTVYGRAFCSPHETDSPLAGFQAAEDGRLTLACLHGDTAPGSGYGPISQEEIAASGLDYLALGHVHQYSGLQRAGRTVWAYPGCPEGRGFDELGEKGVLLLHAQPGQVTGEFVPLCRRRYQDVRVDVTGCDPLDAVLNALPPATAEDIYRITLTGACTAPDLARLQRALAPRFYGLTVRDETRLPQDLWQRREEDSLTGLFLREMEQLCAKRPDDPVCRLAARFGLAALENGEDICP